MASVLPEHSFNTDPVAEGLITDPDLVQSAAQYLTGGLLTPTLRRSGLERLVAEQQRRNSTARKRAAMSPIKRRRDETSEELAAVLHGAEKFDIKELRHVHSIFALCGLPYRSQPLEVREYERRNGQMLLKVKAGELLSPDGKMVAQPVPYGATARKLFMHFNSEAVRTKSREISLDESMTAYIRDVLGIEVTGGKNGSINAIKKQISALAACTMQMGAWDGEKSFLLDTKPFELISVWLPLEAKQRSLWPNTITYSEGFFESLLKHALPIDNRAVNALGNSPLALDVYFWLTYRMTRGTKPIKIKWESLHGQFGGDTKLLKHFKLEFKKAIESVKELFPNLPLELTDEGASLIPGRPEVLALPSTFKRKPRSS